MADRHLDRDCPACGFSLEFEPWLGDSPSDEICPSCGIQFGYHDAGSREPDFYAGWRTRWATEGMPWSSSQPAPEDWSPAMNLAKFRPTAGALDGTTAEHCCQRMRDNLTMSCPDHKSPYECVDQLVIYIHKFREYGLIIHDGGESSVLIEYCPWCGTRLPGSQRDRWFETLEAFGIDPGVDDLPRESENGGGTDEPA